MSVTLEPVDPDEARAMVRSIASVQPRRRITRLTRLRNIEDLAARLVMQHRYQHAPIEAIDLTVALLEQEISNR